MAAVKPEGLPAGIERIELPVPFLGTVNLWLLKGEPLTLVDTGPANEETISGLERGLAAHGVALEQLELLLVTHHHLDHSGLASAIRDGGAVVAAHATTADWGRHFHERAAAERALTEQLLSAHGVPDRLVSGSEPFWRHIAANGAPFETDRVLTEGDEVDAGGFAFRVLHRPGHSASDTLFVDRDRGVALVGDHLLAEITSGAELGLPELPGAERRRALAQYLVNLRRTAELPLALCLTGHGPVVRDHVRLIAGRLEFHAERLERVESSLDRDGSTAYELALHLWDDETVSRETVLAIWEVLGHLDLLLERGAAVEEVDGGRHVFVPVRRTQRAEAARA
jgi:glyoxylase-like metal-dependent hydrolase (beta-lactamase superfamily II)